MVRTVIGGGNRIGEILFAQNVRMGSLPQLYAATADGVEGGDYIGPRGVGGMRGYPVKVSPLASARIESLGAGLWDVTAKLTGVTPDPA